ncbi:MAG: GNAT family N-acetyltransferase [Butyrivibrio sp.]|nr:GNAT family N-acetyltransferase [Butyrivibrio sp.]
MSLCRGTKVSLRNIEYSDTDKIVQWRNNPRVRNNFIYREVFTNEGHEAWMKNKVETGEVVQLIICENENEEPVGSVYLRDIDYDKKEAEYGIFIGEDSAIGKGFGNEAAKLMCAYARDELGIKRLILRVFKDNAAAMKSYEYAGFRFLSDLPDVECSDGEVKDMILMENKLV